MIYVIDLILGILAAVAALTLLARKTRLPYPILLMMGGLVLGFVPKLPKIHLEPDVVFLFFLPPLLYPAAVFTSWRDFRANLRPILLLAVGLVLFTTCAVGWLAPHFIEGLPIAAAFVLGAIISPPDAVAAMAVTERLQVPRRIITVLEGESLVNDATALVAYRLGVAAVAAGAFSVANAGLQFIIVSAGGILIGLCVGRIVSWIQSRLDDPPIQITLSLSTPFAAYLLAEALKTSGVLSVVTTGLYVGWRSPEIINARMRLQAYPFWEMIVFLLNGFIFVLLGMQLPGVLGALEGYSLWRLIKDAALLSALVIVVRIVWVYAATYLPRFLIKRIRDRDPYPNWRNVAIVGWTGMRGAVSLAAALALPVVLPDGHTPFPARNLILFFTFAIIIVTLVLQGLSLPAVIHWLRIEGDSEAEREEREARLKANEAAMARLKELADMEKVPPDLVERLRTEYEDRIRQLKVCEMGGEEATPGRFAPAYERLQYEALLVERQAILQLRNERVINDAVMRRIERDLDHAEAQLQLEH